MVGVVAQVAERPRVGADARLLGEVRLELDGAAIAPPPGRRARLLPAILALDRRKHSREALAARLWPDVLDASARANLRTTIARLRGALGPAADRCLDVTREHVALAGPDVVWTDVDELDRHLAAGDLDAALGLYRDELAAGLEQAVEHPHLGALSHPARLLLAPDHVSTSEGPGCPTGFASRPPTTSGWTICGR